MNIKRNKVVLLEATSGFGKTIVSLTAIIPIILKLGIKILYICRTHREEDRVLEEYSLLSRTKNVKLIVVPLKGKHELCVNRDAYAHSKINVETYCELLRLKGKCKYYSSRIKEKAHNLSLTIDAVEDLEQFKKVCKEKGLCPYYTLRTIATVADIILCSYSYLSSVEGLTTIVKNVKPYNYVLVLDEAHTLFDYLIPSVTYSITMRRLDLIRNLNRLAAYDSLIEPLISDFLNVIEHAREASTYCELSLFKTRIKRIKPVLTKVTVDILNGEGSLCPDLYVLVKLFDKMLDENVELLEVRADNEDVSLKLLTFEYPLKAFSSLISSAYASLLMSATLTQVKKMLIALLKQHLSMDFAELSYTSFWQTHNKDSIRIIAVTNLSTAFNFRRARVIRKIIDMICEIVEATPYNVGVFAPSFEYLNLLLKYGLGKRLVDIGRPIYVENPRLSYLESQILISSFKRKAKNKPSVLLAVQGGRFSEGEDFPGETMQTAIILGVAYAKPTVLTQRRIQLFEKILPGEGVHFGYVVPAINRLLQTAGRVLRGFNVRKAIILVDSRFKNKMILGLLPSWFKAIIEYVRYEEGSLKKKLLPYLL